MRKILMMVMVVLIVCAVGVSQLLAASNAKPPILPKYGPVEKPIAIPLSSEHSYFDKAENASTDFWTLISYYVPQFNGAACSVASVANILNGLRKVNGLAQTDADKLITQEDLVDTVKVEQWKERASKEGANGAHGMTLKRLASVIKKSLSVYHLPSYTVVKQEIQDTSPAELKRLREALKKNEKSAKDFMVIHFVQDELTAAAGGPYAHISPIGAYDEERDRVLILDVDREYYEPYWVPTENLLRAMARKTDAFGYGGYIWVKPRGL